MTSTLVPSKLSGSGAGNPLEAGLDVSASDAVSKLLLLIGRMLWLGFLLGLFILSLAVWIWIASFRSGWRFWEWVKEDREEGAVSVSLVYGLIILFISPVVVFFEWTQKFLPEGFRIPMDKSITQLIQDQLHIDLGDSFPFAPMTKEEAPLVEALPEAEE
ncbi:MAG: hypothetical protein AAFO84_11655 [Cyanobacteria bacterium J06598_1]